MKRKVAVLISLSIMICLSALSLQAQENKSHVSVFIESQAEFVKDYAGENLLSFHMNYDDRYIDAKQIKEMTETIPEIVKFGIKNSPDEKTGRYACYIRTTAQNPEALFLLFLQKFNCQNINLEGNNVEIANLKEELNNLK